MQFRKQIIVIAVISFLACISIAAINKGNEFKPGVYINPSEQRSGDAQKGYDYLVNGDYLKSGLGYIYYVLLNGKDRKNYLGRTGKAANVSYNFNLIKSRTTKKLEVRNGWRGTGRELTARQDRR